MKKQLVPIRDFAGLNRLDGADRVQDNQFFTLQNWYQATKGLLYKTQGTTSDLQASSITGCAKFTGFHRHYAQNGTIATLYQCEPNTTARPAATTDLTLTILTAAQLTALGLPNGNMFGSLGYSQSVKICYTFVGQGLESQHNSIWRTLYISTANTLARNQTGHQRVTQASLGGPGGGTTSAIQITVPTFPAGVTSVNLFASRGDQGDSGYAISGTTCTEMTYIGTVTQSGGTYILTHFIAPAGAGADAIGYTPTAVVNSGGTLKSGTYFVSIGSIVNTNVGEEPCTGTSLSYANAISRLSNSVAVKVIKDNSKITVTLPAIPTAAGTKSCYVFIGTKDPADHPSTWVGNMNLADSFDITSMPDGTNAQTFNGSNTFPLAQETTFFASCIGHIPSVENVRTGFLIRKVSTGAVNEILPSRSLRLYLPSTYDPVNLYSPTAPAQSNWLFGYIRTNSDNTAGSLVNYNKTIYPVNFAYLNGLSYFVNGIDIPWQTDGKSLGVIVPNAGATNTGGILPPFARFISVWQDQLLLAGADAKNQVYACNSNSPRSWCVGGNTQNLRFVTVGDLFGDNPTAMAVFARTTDAINSPDSYFLTFKKHGTWMLNTFPDPSTAGVGASMKTLSGRIGCVAPKSIVSTPLGVLFLGNDGDVYMVRGGGEPYRIGTKVKALFAHLVGNDTLMSQVSAVYHDDHYKISYPSSSNSTGNDAQLWADLRTLENSPITWSGPHTGISVASQMVYVGESDNGNRMALLSDGSRSVRLDDTSTYTHLGTNISSVLQSKTFRFRSETQFKRILGAMLDAYFDTSLTHNVLIEFFADEFYSQVNVQLSNGGGTYDSSQFDQALWSDAFYEGIPFLIGDMNLVGRTLSVKITHSNPNPFIIASIVLPIKTERRSVV